MEYSARKCRKDRRNILAHLRDREFRSRGANSSPELLNFVDDVTSVSTFDNNPIFTGGSLRSTFMIVFSHDGSLVASSHGNHKVKVCQLSPLECIQTLSGHPRSVWSLCFHPSSNDLLASGCLGGQVRVWDLQGRSEVWNCERGTTITSLSFHPHERVLAIATANQIYLWDWSNPTPFTSVEVPAAEEYVRLIRFDHHGHHLLTGISNAGAWDAWYDGLHQGSRQPIPSAGRDSDDDEVPREPDTIPDPSLPDPPPDSASAYQHRRHTATNDLLSNRRPRQLGGYSMLSAWTGGLSSNQNEGGHTARGDVSPNESESITANSRPMTMGRRSETNLDSSTRNGYGGGNSSEADQVTGHMGDHTSQDSQNPAGIPRLAPGLHPLQSILGAPAALERVAAQEPGSGEHSTSSLSAGNGVAQAQGEGAIQRTLTSLDPYGDSSVVNVSEDSSELGEAAGPPNRMTGNRIESGGIIVVAESGGIEQRGDHPASSPGTPAEDPPQPGLSSSNGLLTSSLSGGPPSQRRTPNRVIRVRRRYEGPELVQFRVVSEEFSGPEGRPRRLTAEELSQAVIIRTEQTFHIPDLPESQRRQGESPVASAARALLFDSDNSNDGVDTAGPSPASSEGRAPSDDRSPFTGLPIGSSLLDHVPNRDDRVEQQVSYPVSRGDGMVGHVTITRSTPADSSILRALQLQRSPGTGSVSRRTHGARRALPTQLSTGASGRRGSRAAQNPRDEEGGSTTPEATRRSRLSRFGFARTAMRRRSGRRRRHAQPEEEEQPPALHVPQGEYRNFINQALADAFQGRWSNPAVANNINDVTHRLQWWDFTDRKLPDISNPRANVIVPCCKLYSDASCDISPDGKFLVTFVPNFPDQFMAAAHSLEKHNFGTVLFSKKCGAEAITMSISPSSRQLLVGLATSHFRCPAMPTPLARICKLSNPTGKEGSMELQQVVNHPKADQHGQPGGLNIARWIPSVGAGFVYGTVKGDLRMCKPRFDESRTKQLVSGGSSYHGSGSRHGHYSLRQSNPANPHLRPRGLTTQSRRRTHTAGTQTDLTSRYVRRRLNPPTNTSSNSFSSRLAVNMSDAFNNWSPVNQPPADSNQTGSSSSFPAASGQARSSQPTSDTSQAVQGIGTTDQAGLSNPPSATPDQAALSDPTHDTNRHRQDVDTSDHTSSLSSDNNCLAGPSDPCTINQEQSYHASSSNVQSMQDDAVLGMTGLNGDDPERMEASTSSSHPVVNSSLDEQQVNSQSSHESTVHESVPRGHDNTSSQGEHSPLSRADEHSESSQVDSSGSSGRGRSSSRSSQVDLNGSMVSLSAISNNEMEVDPSAASCVESSNSSITANDQNGVGTSSETL